MARSRSRPQSTAIKLAKLRQPRRVFWLHLRPSEAPLPVTRADARQVHAAICTQAQHVLQGVEGGVGDAGAGGADQLPVDVVAVADDIASQNRQQSLPLVCR